MKLVIINKMNPDRLAAIARLVPGAVVEAYPSVKEAAGHVADADAIALWGFQNVEPLLAEGNNIRWVHSLSDGVEKLLTPSVMTRPILLTNSHGVHDKSVSEHAMAILLAWYHKIPQVTQQKEARIWKRPKNEMLDGKTMLLAGFGGIGRAIAERAKIFGMKIIAVRNHPIADPLADRTVSSEDILSVLPEADVVVAALPTTPATNGFFGDKTFSAMKDGAFFINIARASVVDEAALVSALETGKLSGAGLDVFSTEPLPADHPFWTMENVIITPHVASFIPDFWERVLALLEQNFKAFAAGQALANVIDKEKGY